MKIVRTIECGVKGCGRVFTESFYNQGFPDWGDIGGFQARVATPAGEIIIDRFWICPDHMRFLALLLQGELG